MGNDFSPLMIASAIGVQSFNDNDLKRLGRKHSANEAIKAIDIAKSTFYNVNLDLIYGRQFQKLIGKKTQIL